MVLLLVEFLVLVAAGFAERGILGCVEKVRFLEQEVVEEGLMVILISDAWNHREHDQT